MQKDHQFRGKITFTSSAKEEKTLMNYKAMPLKFGFDETIMSAFEHLNFRPEEKKALSKDCRNIIACYKQINPFELKSDAKKFIETIIKQKEEHIKIYAQDYGVYICLTALYSGKLPTDKKFEFHFSSAPIALFPETLLRCKEMSAHHKMFFASPKDCWLSPFKTLYEHSAFHLTFKKVA